MIAAVVAIASASDAAPRELTAADLGWPSATTAARAAKAVDVVASPERPHTIGQLAAGTVIGWKRIVSGRGCPGWLELAPRGFVCARALAPTADPPSSRVAPAKIVDDIVGETYLTAAPGGAALYSAASLQRAAPTGKLAGATFLQRALSGVEFAGGVMYVKTIAGWLAAGDLEVHPVSQFAGVTLDATTTWPLAWIVPRDDRTAAVVRSAPEITSQVVRERAARERVPVLEQRGRFVRIADGEWVEQVDLRIAANSPRPRGVRSDERWLDVDLDNNTLVAYEGDKPVFATLVSTGFGSTPPSLHRIVRKDALRTLTAPSVATGSWSFPDVPFVLEFRKYYALHAVYWHDGFGTKRGHGCVNLSPRDARTLYDFTLPHVPEGWLRIDSDREGTPVRIRNRHNPDPTWQPWNADPPTVTKPAP